MKAVGCGGCHDGGAECVVVGGSDTRHSDCDDNDDDQDSGDSIY